MNELSVMDINEMRGIAIVAMQSGFPKVQANPEHIIEICEKAVMPRPWNTPESAPKDGTTIDVYFLVKGKNTLSRTRWMTDESRWNGMAKGEEIHGWISLPVPPANGTRESGGDNG